MKADDEIILHSECVTSAGKCHIFIILLKYSIKPFVNTPGKASVYKKHELFVTVMDAWDITVPESHQIQWKMAFSLKYHPWWMMDCRDRETMPQTAVIDDCFVDVTLYLKSLR